MSADVIGESRSLTWIQMRGRLDQQNKSRQNSLIAQLGRIWEVVSKRSASQPISGCRLRRHFKQTPPGPDSGVGKRSNEMNIRGRVRMSNYAVKVNSERLGLTDVCVTLLQDTKAALLAGSRRILWHGKEGRTHCWRVPDWHVSFCWRAKNITSWGGKPEMKVTAELIHHTHSVRCSCSRSGPTSVRQNKKTKKKREGE